MITLRRGDITEIAGEFDAIVNAANISLLGGGGVDGAIHKAAGPMLLQECETLGGCETGAAKTTYAYNLPCKCIIHAVGPRYNEKESEMCDVLLFRTYLSAMEQALIHGAKRIAFPSISTGIFHFPIERATEIALSAVKVFLEIFSEKHFEVTWVLFSDEDFEVYRRALNDSSVKRLFQKTTSE